MARGRSTPYAAQLERFLSALDGQTRSFSAATLEREFTHPPRQKRGTSIAGIHKALMRAFADGKVISFVDDAGTVLREDEIVVPGSKAIGQPQIFATPGTPSPDPAYRPVAYEELQQRRPRTPGREEADAAKEAGGPARKAEERGADAELGESGAEPHGAGVESGETGAEAGEAGETGAERGGAAGASGGLALTVAEAAARRRAYVDDPPDRAPDWVPLSALRVWAATPAVVAAMRRILHEGRPMLERLALIQAGVPRKGEVTPASPAARGIALLCRRPGSFWGEVARGAARQYADDGQWIDEGELARFAADPVAYYLESEPPPFALLLCGVAMGLDEATLRELVDECDDAFGADDDEGAAQAEERIAQLESMLADARKAVKDAEKAVKAANKRAEALAGELQRAREAAHQEHGEALVAEQTAHQATLAELAAVKTELEEARADAARAHELEAEVQALQRSRDALLSEERSIENERRLREEIEAQMQDQMRQLSELRARLRDQSLTSLPTADGPALLRALTRPVGEAARLAGERMAEGRSSPGDAQLLAFAATVMETSAAMQVACGATSGPPAVDGRVEPDAATAGRPAVATADAGDGRRVGETDAHGAEGATTADAEAETDECPSRTRRRRLRQSWFTIRPVGGAREIGGSAILVETENHHRVLLDAGQRVKGEYGLDTTLLFHRGLRGVDHLHGILISHAHIDHIGSLPPVWEYHSAQQDADVPIWMTAPTKDLARIMLKDSARIQHVREYERDALAESDFGAPMEPVYTEAQVNEVLDVIQTAPAYEPVPIAGTSLVAQFFPVSHVLGSCAIHLRDTESGQTLLYTGDLGPISQPQLTLPDFGGTQLIQHADTIIMESTYGLLIDSEREGRKRSGLHGREREISVLFANAERVLDRGGFVLMPSFSLGRTQELVRLIGQHMKDAKIYIAGMGETIFEVYDSYQRKDRGRWVRPGRYPDTDPIGRRMRGYTIEEKVESVLDGDNGFIIASPAMLSGGWSRAFMERMIGDERHAIIFSGYLPRHVAGIPRLRELGKNRTVRIDGEQVTIRCDCWRVGLSAHAPAEDLRRFAREMTAGADHVHFGLVHGEAASQRELAADIGAIENATAKSLSNGEPWTPGRP